MRILPSVPIYLTLLSSLTLLPPQVLAKTIKDSQPPLSEAQVEALLQKAPKSYEAHYQAGRLYQEKGFVGQAQEQYKQAINCPNSKPDAYKQLANLYLRSHDYEQAGKVSTAAQAKFPNDYGVLLTQGYVLHNRQHLVEALEAYEKARKVKPAESGIYLAIADVLVSMNKPKQALENINKAITLGASDNDFAHFEKAKILNILGNYKEAEGEMAPLFEKTPFSPSTNQVYLASLLETGNLEKTLEVRLCMLAKANGNEMQINKSEVGALIAKLSQDKIDKALAKAEKRIAEQALKARLHFAMGDVYDRTKAPQQAISQYQAGLKLDPDFARGYLRLAEDLEYFSHDFSTALKYYKKALELDPKDKETIMRYSALRAKLGHRPGNDPQ